MMDKTIKITLIKSLIGRKPKHIQIAKQLGLGKMHSSVLQKNTPAIRGLTNIIHYLLHIEEGVK
jgi:large subunit ribosomal protein L30